MTRDQLNRVRDATAKIVAANAAFQQVQTAHADQAPPDEVEAAVAEYQTAATEAEGLAQALAQ